MTTFCMNRFNHGPLQRVGLDDITFAIAGQLNDLGHKVILDDHRTYQDPLVNVLFEGFNGTSVDLVKRTKDTNARIVVVLDALPTDKGFEGHDANFLRGARMDGFIEVAPIVDAIWCTDPDAMEWATALNPNTTLISLGWSRHLENELAPEVNAVTAPIADFCFFGEMTPYRRNALLELRKTRSVLLPKKTVLDPNYMSRAERNSMILAARAVLCLPAFPGQKHFSQSRALMALMLGRVPWIVGDPLQGVWDNFRSRIDDVPALLDGAADIHDMLHRYLVRTLTPEFCLGDAIRRLGV